MVANRENNIGQGHAEEELHSRGLDSEQLMEVIPDLVFRVDREGKILAFRANDGSKLYAPHEAIVGRSLHATLPSAVADGALQRIVRTLDTGEAQAYEYKLPMPQGALDFEARMVLSGANEVLCLVRDVTEIKQAERALRRQNGYLAALHETALDLMHRLEPADLLRAIVARAGALMGTPHGYVYLLEPGGTELEMRVGVGAYEEYVGYRLNPGEGLAGKVQGSGQSLVVEDYAAWEGHSAKFGHDVFRAVVGVPLKSGPEVVGVIGLSYLEEDRAFGDAELALLTRFAELASIALDNARLHTSAQQELAERERVEGALRGSEEQYRMLVETVQEGIGFVDAAERITYCNRAYAGIFGLTPRELTGRSLFEFLDDEQRQKAREQTALRREGIRSSYEIVVEAEGGERKHLSASGSPIVDEGGRFRGAVHAIIDVTERKRAEALLRQQSTAIENSIDGMAILDEDGEYAYVNEAHARLYGYDERDELLGKGWGVLYDDEQLARFHRHTMPTLRANGQWRGEAVGRRRDGSTFPQELSISAIAGGGFVCVVRDVTERKRAEEARRESEERFRHLIEQAADALFVHDLRGRFVDANQKACELLGYTKDELLTMSVADIEENFDPAGLLDLWDRVADKRSVMIEGINRHKNGTLFPVEIHLGWFEAEGERLVLAAVRDVTERKLAEETLRQSEERYRAVFERTTDGIFLADFDSMRIVEFNSALRELLGYSAEELRGKSLYDVIAEDRESIDRNTRRIQEEGSLFVGERRYRRKDGSLVCVETSASRIPYGGREVSCCIARDVTERKEAEAALKESEERFRAFFEHSATGISIATPDRRLIETNPAYQRMTGYTAEELRGMPIANLSHPDDVPEDGELNEKLRSGVLDRYQREKRYLRKNGETVWVRPTVSTVRREDGEPRFLVGMVEDVTERKALEESLAHRATHDPLTGLSNRSLLTERLGQALSRAERKGGRVALLFLDLDNFKVVNDSMGHEAGDRLLVAVAERLKGAVRPEDTVARLGGDEFVVLLEETDLEEAARVSDRIAESLQAPFALGAAESTGASTEAEGAVTTREVFVSASVGISMSGPDGKGPGQLLREADLAMYRAKAQGKARHAIFEEKADEGAARRLDAENKLRKAIERGEILAHYQPKVSVANGRIVGMEALARWADPERGLVLPDEFIPLAEETGLIVPMGE